jgi:hypothetical protein
VTLIKKAAGENILYAYDCITDGNTTQSTNQIVSSSRPVKLFTSLAYNPANLGSEKKDNVTFLFLLAYLATDRVKKFGQLGQLESPPGLFEAADKFMIRYKELINQDPTIFKAMPVEVISGGFDVIKIGMEIVRKGENKGKKIVVLM